jgi:hypothetical protein
MLGYPWVAPYTIPMLICKGIVGYRPTATIIELVSLPAPSITDMWSVHDQMLVQGSTTNGPQLTQAGDTTLEPRISTYHSPSFPSDDAFLSPSCPARSQI